MVAGFTSVRSQVRVLSRPLRVGLPRPTSSPPSARFATFGNLVLSGKQKKAHHPKLCDLYTNYLTYHRAHGSFHWGTEVTNGYYPVRCKNFIHLDSTKKGMFIESSINWNGVLEWTSIDPSQVFFGWIFVYVGISATSKAQQNNSQP